MKTKCYHICEIHLIWEPFKTTSTSPPTKCMEQFSIPKGDPVSWMNMQKERKELSNPIKFWAIPKFLYSSDDSKHILAIPKCIINAHTRLNPLWKLFSMDNTSRQHFQSQHATRITVELVRNKTSQAGLTATLRWWIIS
jgi:hypothetical protein